MSIKTQSWAIFGLTISLLVQRLFCCQIYGLAYTPYRIPDACPTEEEVIEDLQFLFKHSRHVRTYSMGCMTVNRVFLEHASRGELNVLFGLWIDGNENDQVEIDKLLTVLAEYPQAQLDGIAVGNEVAFRESMPITELVNTVASVRNQVRELAAANSSRILNEVPVFTIDIIPLPALVAVSDVVAMNIHPFYRRDLKTISDSELMANRILEATAHQIDFFRNLAPMKQIVVTEIGWPTQSAPNDVNVGNLDVAYRFLQVTSLHSSLTLTSVVVKKFAKYADANSIQYYWFELFDSIWKKASFPTQPDSLSEFHWGIYEEDRETPKFQDFLAC